MAASCGSTFVMNPCILDVYEPTANIPVVQNPPIAECKHVQTLFPKHGPLTSGANCDYTGRQSWVQRLDFCRGYELGKAGGISWGADLLVPIFRASLDRGSLGCYHERDHFRVVYPFPPTCRQEVLRCSVPAARPRTAPGVVSAPSAGRRWPCP